MIILLDTSKPACRLTLVESDEREHYEWQSDKQLAKGLLSWLQIRLTARQKTWSDIEGFGVFMGPGSFTGLRIGLTVLNTLADSLKVPIVGAVGKSWQDDALARLVSNENDHIVLPFYGSDANITAPRK